MADSEFERPRASNGDAKGLRSATSIAPSKIVYLAPIECDQEDPTLRFRLVYQGPLRSSQPSSGQQPVGLANHKQEIRKVFHKQLKGLWNDNKFLSNAVIGRPSQWKKLNQPVFNLSWDMGTLSEKDEPLVDIIAEKYHRNGYRFVPLVYKEASLLCSLDILFLRRDIPGSLLSAGDLDNRLKTLVDALRMPGNQNEIGRYTTPAEGEDPFFCLLDDDKGVTSFRVESDNLLQYDKSDGEDDRSAVNLIITVEIKPYDITLFNLAFS